MTSDNRSHKRLEHPRPASAWRVTHGGRQIWQRFRADWQQIPYDHRKQWFVTAGIGLLVSALLSVALTLFGRWLDSNGFLDKEAEWLRWIANTFPLSFEYSLYLGVIADTVVIISVVVAATLLAIWVRRPLYAVSILASLGGSVLIIGVGWLLWDRARPEIIKDGVVAPSLHSFPSGHTVEGIAIYGLFFYFWISASRHWGERILAGLLYLLIILIVAFTRLELGAHWPSDIVASILLGAAWLITLILALRRSGEG
jgi:membrane-associated phospholipid phosphatase